MALLGFILVGIWFWDEAALKIDSATGNPTVPFLWKGKVAQYVPETYLMAIGFILIIFGLMRKA